MLPKIPLKTGVIPPPIQLAMAEIIEEADQTHKQIADPEEEVMMSNEPEVKISPELNIENAGKAFTQFADKQKVSIISLIKLLIPIVEGSVIIVTMTRQQEEFIGDIKIQWQAFLRQYFNHPGIVLQIRIDEQANTHRKAYTQSEQFQEMLDENETFRQLVNKLKLKLK